jgi:protoporphyrinogen oxidase
MENTYDVIVIGAGAAGLTAAYELNKNKPKCKLIVLEARGGQIAFYKGSVHKGTNVVDFARFCLPPSQFTQNEFKSETG